MNSITSAVIGSLATHLAQVARLPFLKPPSERFKKSFRKTLVLFKNYEGFVKEPFAFQIGEAESRRESLE